MVYLPLQKVHLFLPSVSVERWCRLRGNLLFYFKSRDQWSEPAGVIVLDSLELAEDNSGMDTTFGLSLRSGAAPGPAQQHLGCHSAAERDTWRRALETSAHAHMRAHVATLRARLAAASERCPGPASSAHGAGEKRMITQHIQILCLKNVNYPFHPL